MMADIKQEPKFQEYIMDGRIFRILIIDDSRTIRTAIKSKLEARKLVVKEASSGKEAIKLIREQVPDLILLDVVMPELDGLSVLKIIRKS